MTDAQKAEFRQRLIQERERIVAEWESHGGEADPSWNIRNPEDRASQISSELVERRITADDSNLLDKVNFALMRLDDGTYTQCANCGEPIPFARLKAKPSVSLCITCQEAKDAGKI